jgi:predicted NBD/HSP70 family sugar kinase
MSTSSATEITARLRSLHLLAEAPAPVQGRGRPSTVLQPHPDGPLVLAVELRHEDWRVAVAGLHGHPTCVAEGRHDGGGPDTAVRAVAHAVQREHQRHGRRVRAVSVTVAGTVVGGQLVQASTLGWGAVDLSGLLQSTGMSDAVPLLVGNDATLAAVAEGRTGSAAASRTALHLIVEVGVGGALVIDGRPLTGAGGAAGEFGHLPFGDPTLHCPCGARGCWDLEVDGRALARHLGAPPPHDPRSYARRVLDEAPHHRNAQEAVNAVATAIARGTAGLVNAHDPDVVTLGGLAVPLRTAAPEAFESAYIGGLMTFRRRQPPKVLDARHGEDGALHGAIALGLDHAMTDTALDAWAQDLGKP